MFGNLSERLSSTVRNLSGRGRLSEANIKEAIREVRMALLDADVALPVVKTIIETVKEKALGQTVLSSLRPGEAFVKIVQDELTEILGAEQSGLNLEAKPPIVILMAGLQGSGKTTTTAKLAAFLKTQEKKSVLLVSTDIYRPAAIKQLETLAGSIDVEWFPSNENQKPVKIASNALAHAKKQFTDILIIDTAGRLHVDDDMMSEIKAINKAIDSTEILFVVDSMTGQDAANTAKVFDEALPLTGVVLTKIDGDARGGAALSIRQITGKPIKFIGVGEKIDALEYFHPERIAARILDMGDMVSLVEEVERKVDRKKAKKLTKKIRKGGNFNLQDFLEQLEQMQKLGGVTGLLGKLPGMKQLPQQVKSQFDQDQFKKMKAMIQSMTEQERFHPSIIKGSRKMRIIRGSGTQVQDLNRLLKQFLQMQKMMKKMSKKGGMQKMLRTLQSAAGGGQSPFGGGNDLLM